MNLKVPGANVIKDGSQCCNGGIGKVSFVHVIWNKKVKIILVRKLKKIVLKYEFFQEVISLRMNL